MSFGAAALGASQNNSAIRSSASNVREAFMVNQRQINLQAGQQRDEVIRRTRQIEGAAMASLARRGVTGTDTASALLMQNNLDAARNVQTVNTNQVFALERAASGANAQLNQLDAQVTNPLLAAVIGGVQDIQTGLNIASGVRNLRQ